MGLRQSILSNAPGPIALQLLMLRRKLRPSAAHRRDAALVTRLSPDRTDPTVIAGPFKGLKLGAGDFFGRTIGKMLGAYEIEIAGAVEALVAAEPDVVLDIGTADGYYAVGLARRLPRARVVGFDLAPIARHLTRRAARLNDVESRLTVLGACTPESMRSAMRGAKRPAILCDCEGYEDVLLDPRATPELRGAMILVELHDMFVPGVTDRIRERFAATHTIAEYGAQPRTTTDAPPGLGLSDEDLLYALDEGRWGHSNWMWMRPR